ncbi:MAG TPA: metallophosphoesterase [Verrucomicrobiae bacterium]|jgi:3',5'-cyclic AMP phosphodiesterase CpdA|nr:metallophosphoesterase [Verrucomicrobiae bacterium]
MPICLPPVSRRQFLRQAAGAAAALALSPACAHAPGRPQTWALLSDIHIAADPRTICKDVNMTDNLRRVTQEVLAWNEHPAGVFINGDLAFQEGDLSDYQAVGGLLQPLRAGGLPLCLALGNHDNREHFWETLRADESTPPGLANRQVEIIPGRTANWFVLDSLIKTKEAPGLLGPAQRTWLAQALDAHRDKPAIVLTHHQPDPGVGQPSNPLQDTAATLEILRPRRHVKAWLFGHTHRWGTYEDPSGLHLINLPPVAYLFDKGPPNGWVQATVGAAGMKLELRCLDRTRADHGQVFPLSWRV